MNKTLDLRLQAAEEKVADSIRSHLGVAINFDCPFGKAALNLLPREIVQILVVEGWKPPDA